MIDRRRSPVERIEARVTPVRANREAAAQGTNILGRSEPSPATAAISAFVESGKTNDLTDVYIAARIQELAHPQPPMAGSKSCASLFNRPGVMACSMTILRLKSRS